MKTIKYIILVIMVIMSSKFSKAQINGFTLTTPTVTNNLGDIVPVNASFNWTNTTSSATITINYNPTLISYNSYNNSTLPPCVSVTSTATQVIVTINNLNACTNTGSMSINLNFQFLCPDNCPGVLKSAIFTGTLKDNFNTTQNGTCSANGILNNNFSMFQVFHSFNQATAEITFHVFYNNPNCFKIKNPKFSVAITPSVLGAIILPTVIEDRPSGIHYSASGNIITPDVTEYNLQSQTGFFYVVKLPCNTGLGQVLTTNISLVGENCGVPNSVIFGPTPATYTIPASSAPTPSISITNTSSSSTFSYTITNNGNTPLNLIASNNLPLVHIKNTPSVVQGTNQIGLNSSVVYQDCSNTSSTNYPLLGAGSANSNAPVNTKTVNHIINSLQPGNIVSLTINYDLSSSCSGSAGSAPFTDNLVVNYNCNAPSNSCLNCGNIPGGSQSVPIIYNPHPIISCVGNYENIPGCKQIDDVFNLCYEFKNNGDAPLINGVLNIQLPPWLQINTSSITYNGFSTNPTVIPLSSIKFNLPNLPTSTGAYKICFEVKVINGATAGTTSIHSYINNSMSDMCVKSFLVCGYGSIGIDKKVKGNLDANFSLNGNGTPNSLVDYEITIRNTGTITLNNLEVIDRIPAIGNLTILGNPSSTSISNQFNMQAIALPVNSNYSVSYSTTQNITTGWPGTGMPTNNGIWSASPSNGAVRFIYTPSITLAPGTTKTITLKLQLPSNALTDMIDCNTAGFIAKSTEAGYNINPSESNSVCLTVAAPLPVPCICSTEDRFTTQPNVSQLEGAARPDSTNCGNTLKNNLLCNVPYMFSIRYATQGIVQGQCNVTDSVVVKDNLNSVINIATSNITTNVGISTINIPSFTQNGTYSVTFYLKKNGVVCNTCTMNFNVRCADVPCTSCKNTLTQARLTTTQTNGTTSAGNISFSTGVTVQQVTMSIADIKYHWNIAGCQGDCKLPTNQRACILPTGNNQTVGTLQWSDYTSTNVNAAADNKCLEELKWNNDNSAALVAGEYNIPFNINLPKPLIEGCCKLEVEKLCIRLRFKDINCNLCDTIICLDSTQVKNDCCAGSMWKYQKYYTKGIDWSSDDNTNPQNKQKNQSKNTNKTTGLNTSDASNTGTGQLAFCKYPECPNDFSKCGDTINLTLGNWLIFKGQYQCNPNMTGCNADYDVKIKWNGNSVPYTKETKYTFDKEGIYEVEFIGKCGRKTCDDNKCKHYVRVSKAPVACCSGKWLGASYQIDYGNSVRGSITPFSNVPANGGVVGNTLLYPLSAPEAINIENLIYQCADASCTKQFKIQVKNYATGVLVRPDEITDEASTSIYDTNFKQQVLIYPICGGQNCGTPLVIYIESNSKNSHAGQGK